MIKQIVMWDVPVGSQRRNGSVRRCRSSAYLRACAAESRVCDISRSESTLVAWTMPAMSFSTPNSSPWMR